MSMNSDSKLEESSKSPSVTTWETFDTDFSILSWQISIIIDNTWNEWKLISIWNYITRYFKYKKAEISLILLFF